MSEKSVDTQFHFSVSRRGVLLFSLAGMAWGALAVGNLIGRNIESAASDKKEASLDTDIERIASVREEVMREYDILIGSLIGSWDVKEGFSGEVPRSTTVIADCYEMVGVELKKYSPQAASRAVDLIGLVSRLRFKDEANLYARTSTSYNGSTVRSIYLDVPEELDPLHALPENTANALKGRMAYGFHECIFFALKDLYKDNTEEDANNWKALDPGKEYVGEDNFGASDYDRSPQTEQAAIAADIMIDYEGVNRRSTIDLVYGAKVAVVVRKLYQFGVYSNTDLRAA